jgi:serine/threonine-protein kinase
LCDAKGLPRGGSWADDASIVFQAGATESSLKRVPAAGGTPEELPAAPDGALLRWPQVLPGSKFVMVTSRTRAHPTFDDADIVVQTLPNGPRKVVHQGGYHARYLRSGHLVYMNRGTLFAAPFNLDRLETTGPSVPTTERIVSSPNNGMAQFSVSDTGTVVYLPGQSTSSPMPIHWRERTGKTTTLRAGSADWANPGFSPDGRRLAVDISDGTQTDIWILDWARDVMSRLTSEPAEDVAPFWTPDSQRIAFGSKRADGITFNLYWQRSDGAGDVQRLTESKNNQHGGSFHPNGKILAFSETTTSNNRNVMILSIEGDEATGWKPGQPTVFLGAPYDEGVPTFSPDGRWMAYLSTESGSTQIYVRPFPGPGGKWQISSNAGDNPMWSRTKPELFFTSGDRLMVARYAVEGNSFHADRPDAVWEAESYVPRPRPPSRDLNLHPDGERFVVAAQDPVNPGGAVLILNFFNELRRIADPRP